MQEQYGMIGDSHLINRVRRETELVAHSNAKIVYVYGETGVGKELVAEALFEHGRYSKSFATVNAAAFPESLLTSELFGVERGIATGVNKRAGLFEQSQGGTIFLDELSYMSIEGQAHLLRVLDSGAYVRVGGNYTKPLRFEGRLVFAGQKSLAEYATDDKILPDIVHRLEGLTIHVPPLRDRGTDVVILANHFLTEANGSEGRGLSFDQRALGWIRRHEWPGNVRQLKRQIYGAVVKADGDAKVIHPENLEVFPRLESSSSDPNAVSEPESEGDFRYTTTVHYSPDATWADLRQLAYDVKRKVFISLVRERYARLDGNFNAVARSFAIDRSNFRREIRQCGDMEAILAESED